MSSQTMSRPATFPEDWATPFAEGEPFFFDPMHMPYPLTPLTQTATAPGFSAGFTAALREFQIPVQEIQARFRNHYFYSRTVMAPPASEAEGQAMQEAIQAAMTAEVGRLMERWHGEHLPRMLELHQQMQAFDVPGASDAELLAMLDAVAAIQRESWTIHFRVGVPMLLAIQLFDELYAELFGGAEGDAHALLVGGVSASVRAGFGLDDLAAAARDLGLEPLFRETPVDELLPALQASEAGQALLARLRDYLEEFGLRQDLAELATPTWQEDPGIALAGIRNALLSGRDARQAHAALARSADVALETARAHLARYPEAVRQQFEAMVQAARQGTFLQEEHNFYIDQQVLARLRLIFVQIGQRLAAAGWLAAPDDIFLLTVDEIRGILGGQPIGEAGDVQRLTQARRGEMEQASRLTPPPFIGPPPSGPPPASNPMERAMLRFSGGPPQTSETPGELKGNPGSRGVASGPARVAHSLEEAQSLQPGEILVAMTTMPPWTPLFGIAAAVVTETGGPLSHCAIMAREYGIPAVVGAAGATSAIVTGQQISVDGGRGIVTPAE